MGSKITLSGEERDALQRARSPPQDRTRRCAAGRHDIAGGRWSQQLRDCGCCRRHPADRAHLVPAAREAPSRRPRRRAKVRCTTQDWRRPHRGYRGPHARDEPDGATHWSTRGMAKASGVSPSSVHRIWAACAETALLYASARLGCRHGWKTFGCHALRTGQHRRPYTGFGGGRRFRRVSLAAAQQGIAVAPLGRGLVVQLPLAVARCKRHAQAMLR